MLYGAAPIPASTGHTTRHRVNRGGDKAANSAPHRAGPPRHQPRHARPRGQAHHRGQNKKDILRYLKRTIAREVFHLTTHPQPVQSTTDL